MMMMLNTLILKGMMLATAGGAVGGGELGPWMMPEQAAKDAAKIDWVYSFITWLSIFFFVVIVAVMLWFCVAYRRREGRRAEQTATHNTPLELTWTIIPLILVIAIFYVGMVGYNDLREPPLNAYEIEVTGQRWSWTFNYENGWMGASELHVPMNVPVKLVMQSSDVLHSFYIPAFRVKQDVVPGRYSYLWFEATQPGTFDVYCAEYCGTDHSSMITTVTVHETMEEFQQVLNEGANVQNKVPTDQLEFYARYYLYNRCASCHSLDGESGIGPSFWDTHDNWGKERVLKDGSTVTVDENYILNSIRNPQGEVVEGYAGAMPLMPLQDRQVKAIIRFVKNLDKVVDRNGEDTERTAGWPEEFKTFQEENPDFMAVEEDAPEGEDS